MNYVTQTMPNGNKFKYTFMSDFDIADHFGEHAVRDTYKRCLKEWKTDIIAVAEIYITLNMRCWWWYYQHNKIMSRLYVELFYDLENYVYDEDSPYSKDELCVFFGMTDQEFKI